MTKQHDSDTQNERDRPVEIEVTQEMIEAGLFAYDRLSGAADLFEIVREVYKTMELQRISEGSP